MDDPINLSLLQHYAFCPRQAAINLLEQNFGENALVARGNQTHERVHAGGNEGRGGTRTLRALPLYALRHGITGQSDVIEVLPDGSYRPVEYKSGRHKPRLADEVQLCAQAICLEEMFAVVIPLGYIYHAASHKRREVPFTPELRQAVLGARDGVRELLRSGTLPPPAADDRCQLCSLYDDCEPFAPRDFPRGYDPFSTALEDG
ncbi:CRISPR-associated protein Cas4 [uncultured Deinococcus sp.]|uniref:CRISPR-associated protein Cas4 n=1 Tax=uncultured Deinococcus sp. TaxID=158789 RepID=UPI0025CE8CD2|nr:CRISPR-associated protein Cas4 [uncultured Deinococcus sp.]